MIAVWCVITMWRPSDQALLAQGVTSAGIHGFVRARDGGDVDGVRVDIRNTATGVAVHTTVRHGRFVAGGLEVGGPYSVVLSGLGFRPERRDGLVLALGESYELHVEMRPVATPLDTVRTVLSISAGPNLQDAGIIIGDSLLHRLPTLNRNLYDFVELSPFASTKIGVAAGGMSGGGEGFRFNEFLLNGVSQRSVSGHVPPEFSGAESAPFEAVREYRILLTPFDVRYGDFTGALVEAVTRSGTNRFQGSVFSSWRSDRIAQQPADTSTTPYDRLQYGLSFGGPIRRDRLHFFVAADLQRFTSPAPGPYLGQSANSSPPLPVSEADFARLDQILRGYGLHAGSPGPVENRNPLTSLFARVDATIPEMRSRAILWTNASWARNLNFSRLATAMFPLSSFAATQASGVQSAALQLDTDLPRAGGGHNELIVSRYRAGSSARADVRQPIILVEVPGVGGGTVLLQSGTPAIAQGSSLDGRSIELRDDVTLPLGATHIMTVGIVAREFRANRHGVPDPYGTWTFASLDSLAQGTAQRFTMDGDLGSANVSRLGAQYAVYIGDQWQVGERVAITTGLRADLLQLSGHAPHNPTVDSIFGRRTDATPRQRPQLSPRVGFSWDVSGSGRDRLRGGAGTFTVRPPIAWLHAPLYSYGTGLGTLKCGISPMDLGPPPSFNPDYRAPPISCANGSSVTSSPRGSVDLLDRGLRMAQTVRAALAYDRRLPWGLAGTLEAMATRNLADFEFVNLNLAGPQTRDAHGRVLYGTIDTSGVARPLLRSGFFEVIDLRNVSRDHAAQLSAQVEKHFGQTNTAMASYTFSRVRDVQTPLRVNTTGTENWASRAISGREDDPRPGISLNDIPHRVVLAGTQRAPWHRWPTAISFYYVGESGSPFTYVAWSAIPGVGDLNADGSGSNDPIYVPRNAYDTNEVRFAAITRQVTVPGGVRTDTITAAQQADALERFIDGAHCLRRQRGRILERNSCREPWSSTTIASLRQALPFGGRAVQLQLDIYNLLNVVRRDWGQHRVASPALLEQVGQTAGAPSASQPIFHFAPGHSEWNTLPAQSAFQCQLALRYQF